MTRKARSPRWIALLGLGLLVVACAAVVLALRLAPNIYRWMRNRGMPTVGASAPDFSLNSLDGEIVQLSQFRGRPVLVNFAESWCPDCRTEAPLLQALHESHPEVMILMVDKEDPALVRQFVSDFGLTYPALLDPGGTVSHEYRIYGIPTTFFVDADGIIRGVVIEGTTSRVLNDKLPLIGVEP